MKKIKYGEDSEIILIGEFSSVMKKELGFPIEHKFTDVTVKEVINEVTNQEKVNIKAFMQLDEITTRKVNGVDVPFRQGQLCDSTGVVKVALWREYANLESEVCYAFSALIKSIYNNEVQLQSIQSTSVARIDMIDHQPPTEKGLGLETLEKACLISANYVTESKCISCLENIDLSIQNSNDLITCTCGSSFLKGFLTTKKSWTVMTRLKIQG